MTSDLRQLRALMSNDKVNYQDVADFFNQSPQLRFLGIQVESLEHHDVVLTIPEVKDVHQGGLGSNAINGGVIALMCDLTLGLLGVDFWKNGFTGTQSLTIDYLRPLLATKIVAHGKIERVIGKKVVGLIEIANEKGEICSCAHGILATGLKER